MDTDSNPWRAWSRLASDEVRVEFDETARMLANEALESGRATISVVGPPNPQLVIRIPVKLEPEGH